MTYWIIVVIVAIMFLYLLGHSSKRLKAIEEIDNALPPKINNLFTKAWSKNIITIFEGPSFENRGSFLRNLIIANVGRARYEYDLELIDDESASKFDNTPRKFIIFIGTSENRISLPKAELTASLSLDTSEGVKVFDCIKWKDVVYDKQSASYVYNNDNISKFEEEISNA